MCVCVSVCQSVFLCECVCVSECLSVCQSVCLCECVGVCLCVFVDAGLQGFVCYVVRVTGRRAHWKISIRSFSSLFHRSEADR